jgi:hypothetical protein
MNTDKTKITLEKLLKFYGPETDLEKIWRLVSDDDNYVNIYVADSVDFDKGKRVSNIGIYFDDSLSSDLWSDNDDINVSKILEEEYKFCEAEFIVCIEALKLVKEKTLYVNIYTNSIYVVDMMEKHFYSICYEGFYKKLV